MKEDYIVERLKEDVKTCKKRLKFFKEQDKLYPGVVYTVASISHWEKELLYKKTLLSRVRKGMKR